MSSSSKAKKMSRPAARRRTLTNPTAATTLFPLPQRVRRIPRPDGATIILIGPDTAEIGQYFDRVETWVKHEGQARVDGQRPFENTTREVDRFIEHTNSNDDLVPPHDCTIDVEYPPATKRPPAIVGDTFATTGIITRRSVSSYILAKDDERFPTTSGLAVRHREGPIDAELEIEMRESADEQAVIIATGHSRKPDHNAIRSAASQLGGVHEDVLDICIANAVRNGPNAAGHYEIDIDAIVRVRGRGQKKKQEGPARYNAGFIPAMRINVAAALSALERIWVTQDLEPKLRKGKLVRQYDRVFWIKRRYAEDGTNNLISIEYEFGNWFANFQQHLILAPRALLALDARNGAPAKALGRYFTLLSDTATPDGHVTRSVRDVIATVKRSFDYGKNPQRLRSWLEDSLKVLVEHQIISSWAYTPTEDLQDLPRKNWIDAWLELSVSVTLPQRTLLGE